MYGKTSQSIFCTYLCILILLVHLDIDLYHTFCILAFQYRRCTNQSNNLCIHYFLLDFEMFQSNMGDKKLYLRFVGIDLHRMLSNESQKYHV